MGVERKIDKSVTRLSIAGLLVCCMLLIVPLVLAGPKGKALGEAKPHNTANPAGIILGTGGIKIDGIVMQNGNVIIPLGQGSSNIGKPGNPGTIISPDAYIVKTAGNNVFLIQPGSSVIVKLNSKNNQANNGNNNVLAAGDIFANAIEGISSLSSTLPVPDQIGAKGPNPVYGGKHDKKGDGNPGGGNGNGHWGEENQGDGVGNTWTGNQGYGVGEGMAGGKKNGDPDLDPDPDPDPEPEPEPEEPTSLPEAAPLAEIIFPEIEGCPALMQAASAELGILEQTFQLSIGQARRYQ